MDVFSSKSSKLIIAVVVIIVIVVLIAYLIQSGIILIFYENDEQKQDFPAPEITLLTTASNVSSLGDYDSEYYFNRSDIVYVYLEYDRLFHNVSGQGVCNFIVNVTIRDYQEIVYFSDSVEVFYENKVEAGRYWPVFTNSSWPRDYYLVYCCVNDLISGKNNCSFTVFCLECI